MDAVTTALRDVPAGVWTVLVAVLGFLVGWGKDRRAAHERERERRERHELRESEERRERERLARDEARYWRDRHLDVLADLVGSGQAFVNECVLRGERTVDDAALASFKASLDVMTAAEPRVTLLCSRGVRDAVTVCMLHAWSTYGEIQAAHTSGERLPDWRAWPVFGALSEALDAVVTTSVTELQSPAARRAPAASTPEDVSGS